MPGLIDAHVHLNMQFGGHATDRGIQGMQNLTWEEIGALAYESAREFLPAGVTTVRDLCGMSQGLRKHATGRSPISSFSASPGLQTAQTTFSKPPATILPPVPTSPR
jgi:hypothetical protein